MPEARSSFPRNVALVGGVLLFALGFWAMVGPRSFFDSIAQFDPYNEHLIQDVGAFQIGLGATLLLAAVWTSDALSAALIGVGFGALAHVVSHLIGLGLGGKPEVDIPGLSLLMVLFFLGGISRRKAC